MSIIKSGKLWPFAIGTAVTLVFSFCVATVMVTGKANIQPSDDYMTSYQDADINANDYIKAKISFDKKYDVAYITESIAGDNPQVKYQLKDKAGKPVNDAKIVIAISRPETKEFDQKLANPKVQNGIYIFEDVKFPKAGIWNIIAKIDVGNEYRFLNIKADTRKKEIKEF